MTGVNAEQRRVVRWRAVGGLIGLAAALWWVLVAASYAIHDGGSLGMGSVPGIREAAWDPTLVFPMMVCAAFAGGLVAQLRAWSAPIGAAAAALASLLAMAMVEWAELGAQPIQASWSVFGFVLVPGAVPGWWPAVATLGCAAAAVGIASWPGVLLTAVIRGAVVLGFVAAAGWVASDADTVGEWGGAAFVLAAGVWLAARPAAAGLPVAARSSGPAGLVPRDA